MLTLASGMILGATAVGAGVLLVRAVRIGKRRALHWVEMQLESH